PNIEPRTLDADPTAQPVASDESNHSYRTRQYDDAAGASGPAQISTDTGQPSVRSDVSSNTAGASAGDADKAARDTEASALVARVNSLRRGSQQAQQASAVAAPTGTIEPAAADAASEPAPVDRYPNPAANPTDYRQSPSVDPRSL